MLVSIQRVSLKFCYLSFRTFVADLDIILANEQKFLPLQNTIVGQFEKVGKQHLNFVLNLSWVLHALVILTLLLEGIFLFRPVLKKMQELINERFGLMRRTLM